MKTLFILVTALVALCGAGQDAINGDLVINKVESTVDLSTHLPKINSNVYIENTGQSAVKSFIFAVDPSLTDDVSFVGASSKSGDEDNKLVVTETTVANQQGKKFYKIAVNLASGKETKVSIESVYSHTLKPFPAQITQAEKQFVQFTGNSHFYSPYKIKSCMTTVTCSSPNIESYTKNKPVSTSEHVITYGTYENLEPFSQKEMVIHYENNMPFITVSNLERLVEVSHWGNIAIEDTIDVIHSGAELKGPFSRYDYQRHQDGLASVKSFKMVLPASASDVYYRDEIGNISTSNLREQDDMVELEIRPRFPLFGGWKTHYMIGYNVPSYQYLFNNGDQYMLKMRFVDHLFDDQVIDQANVRIILPEGARNLELTTPYDMTRGKDELHYTYLDTVGRPVVVLSHTDLVDAHIQEIQLKYTFPKYMLFQEPLLVVGAFYMLFVLIIIYVRLDFSITKDEARETRLRIAGLIEQVQNIQDRRSALYQSYDDAINKFKSSKDANSFQANRKKIDADYKTMTQQIAALATKLKSENSDAAEKTNELQKLDSTVKDQVNLEAQYAEKLIGGKKKKVPTATLC